MGYLIYTIWKLEPEWGLMFCIESFSSPLKTFTWWTIELHLPRNYWNSVRLHSGLNEKNALTWFCCVCCSFPKLKGLLKHKHKLTVEFSLQHAILCAFLNHRDKFGLHNSNHSDLKLNIISSCLFSSLLSLNPRNIDTVYKFDYAFWFREWNLSVQLSESKGTLTHTVAHCELPQGWACNR